ncbi:unnamed protein product [Fusarium fujikuroi]|uniref:NACHT-NTPase and P-loop NTPases N-terminal domain-containing protein n=1 Tax=Fusarium fujikuroi TaxID=5127 RepID=A0A9Q9UD06_FUSFU|nr:uncharacterized protein FFE2_07881 [Fusarium fujikuroi]SCO41649.1 uncharacterized protein FFNC_08064 [Fusarium fujikuroi]SCV33144.1 uncharacterized protein FFFS_03640 [Fusarium fujikuroi]VTT70436.1 unnamed protein product [Fusarium fujikuroi]VTT82199.1 unnamed protein product [Fusarium fujikuroi]
MAEILGLASGIITIVEVAGKLGTNTIRLKRLWDEVQDVPASIQRCIEQLEILAPAIEEMDQEFEKTRNMIQNDSAAKRSLEYSRKAVETLNTLVRDMETQMTAAKTSRRLVAQLKVRIKRDVIEDHQQRLKSALQLLSLSQQTYLIALSRSQPEIIISEIRNWRDSEYQKRISLAIEDDQFTEGEEPEKAGAVEARDYFKSPGSLNFSLWSAKKPLPVKRPGILGSFAFQSYEVVESSSIHYVPDKARFFQARVQMPWFMPRFWDLSVLRASTGWTFQLNTWNIRPWGTEIFQAVENGQIDHIIKLLKNKEASIYDVDPYGYSLLRIAILYYQVESIKALILMGVEISDIEPRDLFRCIFICFWNRPEVKSLVELGRQWTTEMGGISSEHLGRGHFFFAFWIVPGVYTLLCENGSVRQMLPSFSWSCVNPAVPLELLRSGLAVAADFPPYICSPGADGICRCYTSSLIYQYFHALLNNEKSFPDWRCLARKALLGVSPLDIVHPHEGAFCNLASILKALWKRQFRLLPFARWIQNAVTLWLEDVAAGGMNLEEYMSLELLYSQDFQKNAVCKDMKIEIRPGARLPESGPSLVILSVGPRAGDWFFSWDPCVEELSGGFWTALEDIPMKVPGAWVDERTEDFGCLMGGLHLCWIRRLTIYTSKMATRDIPKEEHKQQMRLQGPQRTERKDRESLQIRGMMTCEEFSPHEPGYWD